MLKEILWLLSLPVVIYVTWLVVVLVMKKYNEKHKE